MKRCVNCGGEHNDINGYCKKCEVTLRKFGLWDYVDEHGFRRISTGESCSHDKFVTLKDLRAHQGEP